MYVNPFLAGVAATLLAEAIAIFAASIIGAIKQNKTR